MRFRIEKTPNENIYNYASGDLNTATHFSNKLKNEIGDFLISTVLFGSSARRETTKESDIDVLVITDDISFALTEALIEAYRIIIENLVSETSPRLHITSMTLTSFWEYTRAGDPVGINILRDGVSIVDPGFFNPMQKLLKQGRLRPSPESVWRYFGRAPKTLLNARWHLLQATLDLYWAVIDSAHAAIMAAGEVPTTPEHVPDILEEKFVRKGQLDKKYAATMRHFYHLSKMITHREIKEVKGAEFDKYHQQAGEFVMAMKKLIDSKRI